MTVFLYNQLYQPSVFPNLFLKSGINGKSIRKKADIGGYSNQDNTGSILSCMTAVVLVPNDGYNCLKSGFKIPSTP